MEVHKGISLHILKNHHYFKYQYYYIKPQKFYLKQ